MRGDAGGNPDKQLKNHSAITRRDDLAMLPEQKRNLYQRCAYFGAIEGYPQAAELFSGASAFRNHQVCLLA